MTPLFKHALQGAISLALIVPATAQTYHDTGGTVVPGVVIVDPTDNSGPLGSSSNPMKISGSFSATLSGFQPTPSYSQLALSNPNTSARVSLPSGTVVIVYNTSASSAAECTLGNSSVTATAIDDVIQPSSWMAFTVGANTYIACISTGTPTLSLSGGSGLPTGSGGGGGGGGSNASVGSTGSTIPASATYAAMNVSGNLTGLTGTASGLLKVDASGASIKTTPQTGTFSTPGCTVTTSSAQCLATGTYNHVQIQNTSASASIACSWGGTAALNSNGSVQLAAGQSALWGPNTSGVPSSALNCIGSAAASLYLEYN